MNLKKATRQRMRRAPARHGKYLQFAIDYCKEHGHVTAKSLEHVGLSAKKAYNRLSAWCALGWFTFKGNATFEAGPKIIGERLAPKPGTDEHVILDAIRRSGSVDCEDAEIAIDDVPERVNRALANLLSGGWVRKREQGNSIRFELANDPFISEAVKKRVDKLVEDVRKGLRKFN